MGIRDIFRKAFRDAKKEAIMEIKNRSKKTTDNILQSATSVSNRLQDKVSDFSISTTQPHTSTKSDQTKLGKSPSSIQLEPGISTSEDEPDPVLSMGLDQLNGLSIGTVILLNWCIGKAADAILPGKFSYLFGINPVSERKSLINERFLVPAPTEIRLNALKVTDLKQILKAGALTQSGKKSVLIDRIINEIDESQYFDQLPDVLAASEAGAEIIEHASLLIWCEKQRFDLPLKDFVPFLPSQPPFEPIAIKVAKPYFWNYLHSNQFGLAWVEASNLLNLSSSIQQKADASFYLIIKAMLDFQTTGSNAENDFYASVTSNDDHEAGFIQSYVLDYVQAHGLNEAEISKAVLRYVNKIQPSLPDYVWMDQSQIEFVIDEIINGTPQELHQIQSTFLLKNVPREHLFISRR